MTRTKAWQLDTELYVDMDDDMGFWCVFGNNSGFCYFNSMDKQKAEVYANELNSNKKLNLTYSDE